MTNKQDSVKGALQDVTLKLNWSLHSAANENIISSLLAASLNSSKELREWFCKEVYGKAVGKRDTEKFYALTNERVPVVLKPKETRSLTLLDVLALHGNNWDEWDTAKAYSGKNKGKNKARDAVRKIRAIFVEVKHTELLSGDRTKYENFLTKLSTFQENRDERKFVIISSHSKKAKEKLLKEKPKGRNAKEWYEFTVENKFSVKHILLEEIYYQIKENWCKSCPILHVFKSYLSLVLGIFEDDIFELYWKEVIRDSRKEPYYLKQEITEHIGWLAEKSFIKITRKLDASRIKALKEIKLECGKYHRLKFSYTDNRPRKKFRIILPQRDLPIVIDVDDISRTGSQSIIIDAFKAVSKSIKEIEGANEVR